MRNNDFRREIEDEKTGDISIGAFESTRNLLIRISSGLHISYKSLLGLLGNEREGFALLWNKHGHFVGLVKGAITLLLVLILCLSILGAYTVQAWAKDPYLFRRSVTEQGSMELTPMETQAPVLIDPDDMPTYLPYGYSLTANNNPVDSFAFLLLYTSRSQNPIEYRFVMGADQTFSLDTDNTNYEDIIINGHDALYGSNDNCHNIYLMFYKGSEAATVFLQAPLEVSRKELIKIAESIRSSQ